MDGQQDVTRGWKTLVRIADDAKEWNANGRVYRPYPSVSIDRWEAYSVLQVEAAFGQTFSQMDKGLADAFSLLNQPQPRPVEAGIILHNIRLGIKNINDKRGPALLRLCALFINREGEDIRFIDNELIESKIADWRAEGIELRYFFRFAIRSIPGFIAALRSLSPDTSGMPSEEELASEMARTRGTGMRGNTIIKESLG